MLETEMQRQKEVIQSTLSRKIQKQKLKKRTVVQKS